MERRARRIEQSVWSKAYGAIAEFYDRVPVAFERYDPTQESLSTEPHLFQKPAFALFFAVCTLPSALCSSRSALSMYHQD